MTLTVVTVQQTNAAQHAGAMVDMFRQRARVFADKLGWPVKVINGQERDKYDDLDPVYLICQDNTGHVTGSLRLLPTTGPTLLADAFADTLPDAAALSAPSIWECTRFCAEDAMTGATLMAAAGDVALKSGIESFVANFEAPMLRVYRRIGLEVHVLGSTKRYGQTIFLGGFPVTEAIVNRIRSRIADTGMVAA